MTYYFLHMLWMVSIGETGGFVLSTINSLGCKKAHWLHPEMEHKAHAVPWMPTSDKTMRVIKAIGYIAFCAYEKPCNTKCNTFMYVVKPKRCLELRQYKNNSGQSGKILRLKLPRFFSRRLGDEKTRQFQNWNCFGLIGIFLMES